MSVFTPGASGLDSTTKPAALFEAARLLDASENARNGANPGVAPKQNITVSIDFSTRVAAIAATIPIAFGLDNAGKILVDTIDYLSAPYSTFVAGGDVKSVDTPSLFVEVAQILAAAEKAVTPVDDQPNNVSITVDAETQSVTVSANLPITTSSTTTGEVVIAAVDYL